MAQQKIAVVVPGGSIDDGLDLRGRLEIAPCLEGRERFVRVGTHGETGRAGNQRHRRRRADPPSPHGRAS